MIKGNHSPEDATKASLKLRLRTSSKCLLEKLTNLNIWNQLTVLINRIIPYVVSGGKWFNFDFT